MINTRHLLHCLTLALILIVVSACFPEVPDATEPAAMSGRIIQETPTSNAPAGVDQETCRDDESGASLTYTVAKALAESSECMEKGQLTGGRVCNEVTGTWWLDLAIDQPGCMPACVIDVEDGSAEINWRCTGAAPPEEPDEVDQPIPTPTTDLSPGILRDVSFQDITFSYDDSLAADVRSQMVGVEDFLIIDGAIIPAHEEFSFEEYVLPEVFQEPRLAIFPISEFADGNELAAPLFERFHQLMAEKPADPPDAIPFLPLVNAGPLIQTQVEYLTFLSGEGVRYITQFGQAYLPINNRTLFYTFQGVTKDGGYYVSLVLPVNHPSLPANENELPQELFELFSTDFEKYAQDVTEYLDAQNNATFFPDLTMLDAMVQSLEIKKGPDAETIRSAYDYSGWQTYSNDVFGYAFYYPPNTVIREVEGDVGPAIYPAGASGDSQPIFSVNHYYSDFYRPPEGIDVDQWVLENGIPHDIVERTVTIGGLPAVHLITEPSLGSLGFDEYYVIDEGQLIRILIWPSEREQDWQLFEQFLAGFTF